MKQFMLTCYFFLLLIVHSMHAFTTTTIYTLKVIYDEFFIDRWKMEI